MIGKPGVDDVKIKTFKYPIKRPTKNEFYLELSVSFTQSTDLFDGVATDRIRQIFLGVLEPRVEGRCLLGEGEVQFFNLTELILHAQQTLLAGIGRAQQRVPARDDVAVTVQNCGSLVMAGAHKLILQSGDVLDALLLKGVQSFFPKKKTVQNA